MLNVGASSPLNLHREALRTRLNPSASNSSRSVMGHRSLYSSNKSVTSDDRCATDLEGGNNHHPRSIPQSPSLVSLRTEEASPSREGHDRDQDSPTVLNIRLASRGVYGSDRSRSRGRSGQRVANVYVNVTSRERNSRSPAPSHTVCNLTFRLGDPSLNAPPDICFTVSLAVTIEGATRSHHSRACRNNAKLERRVVYPKKKTPQYPYSFRQRPRVVLFYIS